MEKSGVLFAASEYLECLYCPIHHCPAAPDLIVTAAHCVYYSRTKKPIPPNRLHFVANWRRGKHQAHRRGAIVRIAKDFVFDAPGSSDRLRADLALIQLERPIAPNVIKPIRVEREFRKLRLTTPLTQVAYSADRPHLPVIERGCIVREEDDELLLTDCDSNFGSSGAPVLEEKGGQLRLLAVSVAVISDGVLRRAAALRAAQIETVRRTGRNPHNP